MNKKKGKNLSPDTRFREIYASIPCKINKKVVTLPKIYVI